MNNLRELVSFMQEIIPIIQFWGVVTAIAGLALLLPTYFIFPPLIPLFSLIIVSFCTYRTFKDSRKYYHYKLRTVARLKEEDAKISYQNATSIEILPTAESIQDLILNDGEIPDEALEQSDH